MHLAKWLTDLVNPLRAKWGHQPYQVDASLQEASQVFGQSLSITELESK